MPILPLSMVSVSLLEKIAQGNEGAFDELFQSCFTPVYRYAYARLGYRELAEDIAQTVFSKAWTARDRYEDRGRPPLAYLFTIARNAIIDFQRRKDAMAMPYADMALLAVADDANDPVRMAQQTENAKTVRAMLMGLPEDQRDIILLRYIAELSYAEMAEVTGKTEEALRKTVSRTIHELRQRTI